MNQRNLNTPLFLAWVIALVATLGSLFFSEVMHYVPCSLCWYQRIFMYPLVLVLGTGLLASDRNVLSYAYPIGYLGWFFAIYHNLLHWGVIPESAAPCRQGIACSVKYINWLGFITIPLLSFISFSLILIFLHLYKKRSS